jgi:hypothetical protein
MLRIMVRIVILQLLQSKLGPREHQVLPPCTRPRPPPLGATTLPRRCRWAAAGTWGGGLGLECVLKLDWTRQTILEEVRRALVAD